MNFMLLSTANFLVVLCKHSELDGTSLNWKIKLVLNACASYRRGGNELKLLSENIMSLDFSAFKKTFQTFAQRAIFSWSILSIEAVSVGFRPNESKEVSSAKMINSDSRFVLDIVYVKNKKVTDLNENLAECLL